MYLVDTNIFLEILLNQKKSQVSKQFLNDNIGSLSITDFSLHSIGVILFRFNETDIFSKFLNDTLPHIKIITLPKTEYTHVVADGRNQNLDFDDAYHYTVSKYYGYTLVTMDKDFKGLEKLEIQCRRSTRIERININSHRLQ